MTTILGCGGAWLACAAMFCMAAHAVEVDPNPEKASPLPTASEWRTYNGSYEGQRFSALKQIDTGNVAGLNEVCRVHVGELGPFHTGPVIAAGMMYLTTGHATVAVNPANCDILWKSIYTAEQPEPYNANRGVAYWQGKVFRGTPDARLVAYDAITGKNYGRPSSVTAPPEKCSTPHRLRGTDWCSAA